MLSEKQNLIEALQFGHPDRVPFDQAAYANVGIAPACAIDYPLIGAGTDAFGVRYNATIDGTIPAQDEFLLKDITKWKEIVKIPDVESFPWEEWAAAEMANVDRDNHLVRVLTFNGLFDRLINLMGFEEGLLALVEEPEACEEFFRAIADFKVSYMNHVIKYYKPDSIDYMDDLAHAKGLFMSPEIYRKLIKPHHKRIIEVITSHGIIAEQHTCGKCEEIIPDFVDIGISVWFPAQVCNDLKAIKKRFYGKLVLDGGFDSQGPVGLNDVPEELVRAEVRRAVDEYAEGGGFIFFSMFIGVPFEELVTGTERRMLIAKDELQKYSTQFYANRK